ncbi:hypothetical protein BJ508DRAFT_313857 [Ascobolus immersus RN42]|uniref:Uncharacterized protein n=1 Tax=Ascobolus immersus RN42 TaxID=1160509 RepID=A0A3N4HJ62_ASCIM|nr:hypothetical protein BJ508DRAFT_313857 [Ascobolus immersus RN42]
MAAGRTSKYNGANATPRRPSESSGEGCCALLIYVLLLGGSIGLLVFLLKSNVPNIFAIIWSIVPIGLVLFGMSIFDADSPICIPNHCRTRSRERRLNGYDEEARVQTGGQELREVAPATQNSTTQHATQAVQPIVAGPVHGTSAPNNVTTPSSTTSAFEEVDLGSADRWSLRTVDLERPS